MNDSETSPARQPEARAPRDKETIGITPGEPLSHKPPDAIYKFGHWYDRRAQPLTAAPADAREDDATGLLDEVVSAAMRFGMTPEGEGEGEALRAVDAAKGRLLDHIAARRRELITATAAMLRAPVTGPFAEPQPKWQRRAMNLQSQVDYMCAEIAETCHQPAGTPSDTVHMVRDLMRYAEVHTPATGTTTLAGLMEAIDRAVYWPDVPSGQAVRDAIKGELAGFLSVYHVAQEDK